MIVAALETCAGFPKLGVRVLMRRTIFILGSILGSPLFGKLPKPSRRWIWGLLRVYGKHYRYWVHKLVTTSAGPSRKTVIAWVLPPLCNSWRIFIR